MTGTFRQSFTLRRNIIPKREYLSKGYFCVTDWKTEEIGSQLMLISKTLLNKIYPRELYKAIFLKKDKEITSPNVVKCINKFNKLTTFIMQDILSYNKPKYRAKAYEKWVSVAEYCRINKDYDDLISIFSVFNHYIITGLKLTLKEVKTKANSTLNKIKNFCQVDGNYKKIRLDMDNCNRNGEVFIPYLGMLLRDLNFFEEKSKYINDKGYINFEKIEKIDGLFQSYFKFKYCKDENKNSIPELEFFNDLEDITEEQLDERANEIEPNTPNCKIEDKEKEKKNKKELTYIDKKYFEKYKIKDNDEDDEKDIIGESMNDEPEELLDNAFIQG
jgi:son of sevenless-like protein